MDEEALAINARAEKTAPIETPAIETKAPEVKTDAVSTEKTETSTENVETEGGRQVTGSEKRIHKLVDERDEYKQKAQDLEAKLAEFTSAPQEPGNYPTNLPADGESQSGERELTIDDLRTIARIEVEKERTVNRINSEARDAQKLYPELDKSSASFDPEVNEAVTTAVWLEIQRNPSLSVKKLTDKYMKPYQRAAEKAVGQEKQVLAQQVNDEALRPANIKPVEKSFADKSISEMEAELGIVY